MRECSGCREVFQDESWQAGPCGTLGISLPAAGVLSEVKNGLWLTRSGNTPPPVTGRLAAPAPEGVAEIARLGIAQQVAPEAVVSGAW